ncbi:hypothetical protein PHO31112_00765 [Pandoraea horticolens]|uniref:Surface-adhesin protein E-like domain-containing protein n=1 Tax=Pandoraea horticolens TaxID=2508298 RepID=A0A5E4SJD0_9BURK|nr:surface-adhesin E family protein [Pandoraea horticolens]VVD74544.1 hypothetical protein PHO31112_00765 [Pandoraea horticolens]
MKKQLLLAVAIALSTSMAWGADWLNVYKTKAEDLSLDVESISTNNGYVAVWVRRDIHDSKSGLKSGGKPVRRLMMRWTINCHERTMATGAATAYGANGTVLGSIDGTPTVFSDVVPDSNGDTVMKVVCP